MSSRPTTTRLALAGALLTASAGIGCRPPEPAPLLVPAADAGPAPTVTRIPLTLDEDQLHLYEQKKSRLSFDGFDARLQRYEDQLTDVVSFAETMTPFESFVYDASHDRFIVPGFWAVSRTGDLIYDPPPLAAPAGVQQRPNAELRGAFDRFDCQVIVAVRYEASVITLLCARTVATRAPHRRPNPDVIVFVRIDARTLEHIESYWLPPAPGWDPWSTVERFLESGEVVVGVDASAGARWFPIPRTQGSRYATLRIDAGGGVDITQRGRWYSAGVTRRGEVVGVTAHRRRGALLWFDRGGVQHVRIPLDHAKLSATHAEGVCTLDGAQLGRGSTLSCFDRNGPLRWRRRAPELIDGWSVDDDGWSFFFERHQGDLRATLVAVTPDGVIAWRAPVDPPLGTLLVAGDELCFVPERQPYSRSFAPELVCIGPGTVNRSPSPPCAHEKRWDKTRGRCYDDGADARRSAAGSNVLDAEGLVALWIVE
jgi:hypothetical protein